MKRLLSIIIFVALTPLAWSQAAPISGQVLSQYGQPVAGAQVYVCSAAGSSGLPCSPLANIFYDFNLGSPAPNPFPTDVNGNYNFYVGALAFPNTYVVNAVTGFGTPTTQLYSGPACQLGGCTFTGNVTAPVFNATSNPYYEINGAQISSSALSDHANIAYLNVANVFTGTLQTAPIFNATTQFNVAGSQIASANLADGSNLANLNASNTFTGTTNTFNAITGTTINATAGFQVGGVALAASNLSNGVSGTGAICLASGSACVSSSGLSGMTAGQVPIAATATTVTSSMALAGSGAGITTGPTSSTNGDCATFSGTGGQISDSGTCSIPTYFSGSGNGADDVAITTSASGSNHVYQICPQVIYTGSGYGFSYTVAWTQGGIGAASSASIACVPAFPDSSTVIYLEISFSGGGPGTQTYTYQGTWLKTN